MKVCELFGAIIDLAAALGVKRINDLPGAWLHQVTATTPVVWIAVNGKPTPQHTGPPDGMDVDVDPYHAAIWWNGWLAGIFAPDGGTIAGGSECNEDALIAIIRAATNEVQP